MTAPRGRRPGSSETRSAILTAANRSFMEKGYEATTIRGVARAAGVDPALVHYYFGDKTRLLLHSARIGFDPTAMIARIAAAGPRGVGVRAIRAATALWESRAGTTLIEAINADARVLPSIGAVVSDAVQSEFAAMTSRPPDELRHATAQVQVILSGILAGRYIARVSPLADLTREEVVRLFAPSVQRIIDAQVDLADRASPKPHMI